MNTPRTDKSKFLAAISKLGDKLGVTVLLTRQMKTIDRIIKVLITNDPNDENLKALRVRGRDTGNTKRKLNIAAQNI